MVYLTTVFQQARLQVVERDGKVKSKAVKHYAMKKYGEVDVWIHVFLTSGVVSFHAPAALPPGTHWVGLQNRSGRPGEDKNPLPLPGLELRPLGRPTCSQ
jgi:hypothetical protein